ncbi:MAG: DUF1329 domain-containing protein [Thermodesulfobacteriota bacterium]|nr:DUF1329 domain-containing protein [Thermodesulfobacteriota bacterium]
MRNVLVAFFILFFVYSSSLAEEYKIESGITITEHNYEQYIPELKRLLIPSAFPTVINGLKEGWINVPVIEKGYYPAPRGFAEFTRKNAGKFKVGKDNMLVGEKWQAGLPFPEPKTGAEFGWNAYRRYCNEECVFPKVIFWLFNKNGQLERKFGFNLYRKFWFGRTDIPPVPEIPGNNGKLNCKEAIVVLHPFDVKGFSMVRIRYEELYKEDDVYSYIPAIRRLRRLTGADVTDPMLGSDACYDDFEVFRQKINTRMSFKFLEVKDFLVPKHYNKRPKEPFIKRNCFQVEWEIRPSWVLEMYENDPNYAYSKRVLYIEKEAGISNCHAGENYDQKGRLFKVNTPIVWARDDVTRLYGWFGGLYKDHISGHTTVMDLVPYWKNPMIPLDKFSMKVLLREAR